LLEVETMTGLLTNFLGRAAEQFHVAPPPPATPEELAATAMPEGAEQAANQADMTA
jgi:hypothetical protein